MNQVHELQSKFSRLWYWLFPLLLGTWVMGLFLFTFFQEDDFAVLCWLRYDHPSPIDWFAVWHTGLWRPFQLASLWVEARLFGSDPEGYRIVHGAAFLGSIYLYQRLVFHYCGSMTAWIAAVLFASTLSHWQALQWICASGEIWMGLFFLLCLHALLGYQQSGSTFWRWCVILSHLMALLCKGSSVMLLPMIMVLFAVQGSIKALRCPVVWLGLVLPWLGVSLFRIAAAAQGEAVAQGVFSLTGWHIVHNLGAYYLRMLTHWYSQPPFFAAAVCMLSVMSLGAYLWFARHRFVFGIWLWSLLALTPYCGVNTPGVYPSRYTYLAGLGMFWLLAILIVHWIRTVDFPQKAFLWALGIGMIWQTLGAFFLPEIRYFLRHDIVLRERLNQLREWRLPTAQSIWIDDIEAPPGLDKQVFFRNLYALLDSPPDRVWVGEQPGEITPHIRLFFQNGNVVIEQNEISNLEKK